MAMVAAAAAAETMIAIAAAMIEALGGSTSPSGFLKRGPMEAMRYGGRS